GNPGNGNQGGWRRLDAGSNPGNAVIAPQGGGSAPQGGGNGNWRRLDGPRDPGNFGGGVRQISPPVNQAPPPDSGIRGNRQPPPANPRRRTIPVRGHSDAPPPVRRRRAAGTDQSAHRARASER